MKKLKIGIVGCGAIGSSLAKFIKKDLRNRAVLSGLYDIDGAKSAKLSKSLSLNNRLAAGSLKHLVLRSQLVIECASGHASRNIAETVLRSGRDIMIMSAGGVSGCLPVLSRLAKKNNARVYIPSGAISGVDALKAAALGKIKRVTLTTYKNPLSFSGVQFIKERGIDLSRINKDKVLFCGPAAHAVKYFPQNINVAAVLSMAGIGADKTMVKIVASPAVKKNIHEVRVESVAADITARTENILHPENPKTSYLAVLSAEAVLKQILESVRIGT
ncbi:MAG: DUF108 domain-containing protein [Candidatus Omnitrophota bacterium]|nr:DUF108 domain-containing protein [Candidatus Omnitrophota bacterium]